MDTPENQVNQRSSPRMPAPSSVWLRCRRAASEQSIELANGLLNLSEGGMQFLSRELLAIGDALSISLAGSSLYGAIRRGGEVRWVVELGAGACCAGVRFSEPLTADDVQALFPVAAPATADEFTLDEV